MTNNVNNEQKQVNMLQQINQKRVEEQEKISSGKKINSAADDAAGLAISEAIWSQIDGLEAATRNTYDGINMLNTAEGGMGAMQDGLQRVRELSIQAGNGAYSDTEKNIIGNEIKQILGGMGDISKNTEFNGKKVIDGSLDKDSGGVNFQTGANSGDLNNASISSMSLESMGLDSIMEMDFANMSSDDYAKLIETVDSASEYISNSRSEIGATQNGLESIINSNNTSSINFQDSVSKITDTDMAKATMELSTQKALENVQMTLQTHQMEDSQTVMQLLME